LSNYTKSTDFAAKDSLATGNPAKIIRGVDHDTEYNNISTAIASKQDSATAQPILGFTPVQQGGGLGGQLTNKVYIGHSATGPRLTVDVTDYGLFAFQRAAVTFEQTVGLSSTQTNYASAGLESQSATGDVYISLHASGVTAAVIKHTRGGDGIEIRNASNALAGLVAGTITSNGVVLGAPFPSGTRMPFAQSAAPTGWTQDVSDAANNRMLRVVNVAGGGVGGSHDPITNNVVPAHTHGFTTGTVSADHTHSGSTGTNSVNHTHTVSISTDSGVVSSVFSTTSFGNGASATTSGIQSANHTHAFTTGGISANHTHSGSTDNGSSQTNWTPRHINMIICSKN
jgi:hypothetical protein